MDFEAVREIGDLLFTNVDNGVDRMVYHSPLVKDPSFRDELEMFCYKNKMHAPENPGSLLFMILGYLATFPHTDQFRKFSIKNIFVATDQKVVKVLAQYGLRTNGRPFGKESYKAFVLHLDTLSYHQSFNKNDLAMLTELISQEHPLFNKGALDAALQKVMYISVQKQTMDSQYNVLTYQGTKTFKAAPDSPLTVKAEQVSSTSDAIEWPHKFSKVNMPLASSYYVQLLDKIPALFQNTITAHLLQSSPENLFSFVQGALEFNYQRKHGLQIRSNYDFFDFRWKELLVLPMDNDRWGSDRQPLVIKSGYSSQHNIFGQDDKVSLPSDFNTESPDVEVVRFLLSDLGIIMQYRTQLPIAERISIVDQLLTMVSTTGNDGQLKADATSIIHSIELDNEYFSHNTDSVRYKYFINYMLGKLMGYCSGKDVETFTFKYAQENAYKDLVSFIIKEKGRADGVAFHIQESSRNSQKSTITDFRGKPRPDYSKVGITDRILQVYFDFGSQLHSDEPSISRLSPFQVKRAFAGYTDGIDLTSSSKAEGIFHVIEQHFRYRNLYHLLTRNEMFSLPLVQQASDIGLEVHTPSELHALINSFCLEKAGRNVFLAYPVEDPAILGIKLDPGFPIILMKSGLEKTSSKIMDELRATYMADYAEYQNKRNVFLKVNALTTVDPSTAGEYTNGVYGPFYERCAANGRVRRDSGGDFCRRKNQKGEEDESLIQETYENYDNAKAKLPDVQLARQRVVRHLESVGKLSNAVMLFTMGKNILGALIDGDFKEVAINTGFLAGSAGLGYVCKYAKFKGARLAVEGSRVLGTTLKLAAPFLARVTSAFVAFDLYKQVTSYKDGNRDAIVGVATDSTILAIDVAEVAVEILESLEFISTISSVTGPVGAAIGAIIFVATDIYYAVRAVDKIDSVLTLTGYEKFKEGMLAFIHASPETYIQDLMKNKQLNNEVANRSATILKSLKNVKIYASPTLIPCSPNLASNFCLNGVMESTNNVANFTNLRKFYARTWPNPPHKFQTVCANAGLVRGQARNQSINVESWLSKLNGVAGDSRLSLECFNFEAILDSDDKNGNDAFIKIESGNDTITGFHSRKNIITFTDGFKKLVGGTLADTFILHGEKQSYGFIDAKAGIDTLDFSRYAKQAGSLTVFTAFNRNSESSHFLVIDDRGYPTLRLQLDNFESFIGREGAQDFLMTNCFTKFVDLKGGSDVESDHIQIYGSYNKETCDYNLLTILSGNTLVMNNGCRGVFIFEVNDNSKPGSILLENLCGNESSAQTVVKINKTLEALNYIHRETVDTDTHVDIKLNNGVSLLLLNLNLRRTILIFNDFNMTIEPNGLVCEKKIPVINDPIDLVQKILSLRHIGASFVVEDEEKRLKISAGHSRMVRNKHNMNASAPQTNGNILSNDMQFKQSILLSSQGMQDVYHIKTLCNSSVNEGLHCLPVVTNIYLDDNDGKNSNQTLDLSDIYRELKRCNSTLKVKSELTPGGRLYILLSAVQQSENFTVGIVTFNNVSEKWIKNQLTVVIEIPHYFQWQKLRLELVPKPVYFGQNFSTIVLQPEDIVPGLPIYISKNIGQNSIVAKMNETNLILTNLMDPMMKKNQADLITLIFAKYYIEDNRRKFNSLQLLFSDRVFHLDEISNCEKGEVLLNWEMCHDIIRSLNEM